MNYCLIRLNWQIKFWNIFDFNLNFTDFLQLYNPFFKLVDVVT